MDDLEEGVIPLYERELSAKDAWESIYKEEIEFKEVDFTLFEKRLKDHRVQMRKKKDRSAMELEAFCRDRELCPRAEHDQNGNIVFDISAARDLLRKDVEDGKHRTMTRAELQNSREEYQSYPAKYFSKRIKQENQICN